MTKILLLITGLLLLAVHHWLIPIDETAQFLLFLIGIVLLGIPHGSADLLVAEQNANQHHKLFSRPRFFGEYLGRLTLFGLFVWLAPLSALFVFTLLAAYHFGETDLHRLSLQGPGGKLFTTLYGMIIIGTILLHDLPSILPLLSLFQPGIEQSPLYMWLTNSSLFILLGIFLLWTFLALLQTVRRPDRFKLITALSVQLIVLLLILFSLPPILGFTYYFVVWHSLESLNNIFIHLRSGNLARSFIIRQIVLYSMLAFAGIALISLAGFLVISQETMMVAVFIGLAVLTAPHIQVMHDMYQVLNPADRAVKS